MRHRSLNIIMIAISASIGAAVLIMGFTATSSPGARIMMGVFAAGPLSVLALTLLSMVLPGRLGKQVAAEAVQKRIDEPEQ